MLHPIDAASASSPAKRFWVQRIPVQHHCHLVVCCSHRSGHQSSTGNILAQLCWKLHPLGSWFLQLSLIGIRIRKHQHHQPKRIHLFSCWWPYDCLLSTAFLFATQTKLCLALIGWIFLWKAHLWPILTPNKKEATCKEVVFHLRDLDNFVADGLPVRSCSCVLRIACWWFKLCKTDCELMLLVAERVWESDWWTGHNMSETTSLTIWVWCVILHLAPVHDQLIWLADAGCGWAPPWGRRNPSMPVLNSGTSCKRCCQNRPWEEAALNEPGILGMMSCSTPLGFNCSHISH